MNLSDLSIAASLNQSLSDLDDVINFASGGGLTILVNGDPLDWTTVLALRPAVLTQLQAQRAAIVSQLTALGVNVTG